MFKNIVLVLMLFYFDPVNGSAVRTDESAMTVYKTPSCGCCQKWIDHIEKNGLSSTTISLDDLAPIKSRLGIQGRYRSCHTGVVLGEAGEYVFEGHVPSKYVKQFLQNPPKDALGLSVPGMPIGSPGMEVGDRKDYFQVLLLKIDGSYSIYAHVNKPN